MENDRSSVVNFDAAIRRRLVAMADEQMALMESFRQSPGLTETARWKRIVELDKKLAVAAARLAETLEFSRKGAEARSSEVDHV